MFAVVVRCTDKPNRFFFLLSLFSGYENCQVVRPERIRENIRNLCACVCVCCVCEIGTRIVQNRVLAATSSLQ